MIIITITSQHKCIYDNSGSMFHKHIKNNILAASQLNVR